MASKGKSRKVGRNSGKCAAYAASHNYLPHSAPKVSRNRKGKRRGAAVTAAAPNLSDHQSASEKARAIRKGDSQVKVTLRQSRGEVLTTNGFRIVSQDGDIAAYRGKRAGFTLPNH